MRPIATRPRRGASIQLHFDSEGDGPLVVLLHGFPEFRISWKHQLPALARAGFRAVAPDLRGYGNSPKPRDVDSYRVLEVAGDVAELIASLTDKPCVLVGHDWGAVIAWAVAMTRPELLRKLVILNVPHPAAIVREIKRSNQQKVRLIYQLFFQLPVLPELFLRLFGRRLLKKAARFTPEQIDAYTKQWRGNLTPMFHYYRATPRSRGEMRKAFRRIDTPTLIIWGEREPVFLPSTLEDQGEWVSNVRIERIPRAGHFVQTDAADRVSQLIIEFARA
ncbi:MAG TPA: alpha/beta hydrolase [Thermoanaerobaculia bacterium]|nr:alpha/beta hydrolase [Thermoanaerobaculia bacterium]